MLTYQVKLIVLGPQGAGKTSFINRYISRTFTDKVSSTIAVNYFVATLSTNEFQIKFIISDTAGQEMFHSMVPMFYRKAEVVILLFDITSKESFEGMKFWFDELQVYNDEPPLLFVVANKSDLNYKSGVSPSESRSYAASIGAVYHEVSALSSAGVDDVFDKIAASVIKKKMDKFSLDHVSKKEDTVALHKSKKKKTACC